MVAEARACEICGATKNTHEWVSSSDFKHRCVCEQCISESDDPLARLARLLFIISKEEDEQHDL